MNSGRPLIDLRRPSAKDWFEYAMRTECSSRCSCIQTRFRSAKARFKKQLRKNIRGPSAYRAAYQGDVIDFENRRVTHPHYFS